MTDELFHELIENDRRRARLSYGQLAERAWSTPSYVFRICKGLAKPRRDLIIRLCIALDLTVEETDELLHAAGHPGLLDLDQQPPAVDETKREQSVQRFKCGKTPSCAVID